ncbi:MAG: site-specific DNA-methyltransferase [Eubacteriales bacterium]
MPTLEWIGKDKVINHHQQVPYRILKEKYTFNAEKSDNMIIRGDNLEALKALLPKYEGKVKCIYIDPPYNTGNEGWVYNDNVNDPKIKKWLGEVVGKEGEDLTRHDKWLCMMYPRLRLLQKLLADDGVIFISIDDTEYANLKLICDEIFGINCFVSNISWQRTYSTRNDSKGIVNEVEHLVVYSKQPDWNPNKLPRTAEMNARYKNPDNDIRPWKSSDAFAPGAATHQGMVYAIQHPFTGKMLYPPNGRCWTFGQDQVLEIMRGWCDYKLRDLNDAHERAVICGVPVEDVRQGVQAIVLSEPLEISAQKAQAVYDRGQWPIFCFSNKGKGGVRRKTYLSDVGGKLPTNFWPFTETGHTDEAKKEMLAIFDGKATFDTPKPRRLIEFILKIAGNENALVLDSFAGSGTTAHAVLNMNKADGGNRKFILVEMMDYADSITAERVKRVINGYGEGKNAMEGTGGDFTFYDLGEILILPDGNLNENVDVEKIREYVYYMETKEPLTAPKPNAHRYYMGTCRDTAYYFCYEKEQLTTLDHDFLPNVTEKAAGYLIYADLCTISPEELSRFNITFKKIPRDIAKL